ncbi:hypothetical protein MTP99_015732 [Tenebrio molitor]|nr:hypothetical protein MTP99_015732 [Tenebrio molitor]
MSTDAAVPTLVPYHHGRLRKTLCFDFLRNNLHTHLDPGKGSARVIAPCPKIRVLGAGLTTHSDFQLQSR